MPCKMQFALHRQFAPHVVYYEKHVFPTLIAFHHAPVSKNFALQLVSYFQFQHFSGVPELFYSGSLTSSINNIWSVDRARTSKHLFWKRKVENGKGGKLATSSPSCVFLVFIHFPRVLWAEAIMIAHVWSAREVTAFSEKWKQRDQASLESSPLPPLECDG